MTECRVCSECGEKKELSKDNFQPSFDKKKNKTYFKNKCKECWRLYQQEFVKKNPEYIKQWKMDNKVRIRQQERDRRKNDINFKLRKNVSRAIGHAIVKNSNSVINHLPYTVEKLKQHLENLFDDKMNWDNYGSYWHIDHVVPHSEFKYTSMEDEEFRKCWELCNLRPLEAHQNMSDGSTRIRHKR
jgi:hypothetical protein